MLKAALAEAGRTPLDEEVATTHRLLTEDGVSSGARTQVRRDLERDGIDPERLRRDFVSHQAVHTYLTKHRDLRYERDASEDAERTLETIQRLRSRTRAVVETHVERLRSGDRLAVRSPSVYVDVRVTCEDCGNQYGVEELLDAGGCACES